MKKTKKMVVKLHKIEEMVALFAGLSKARLELLWKIRQFNPDSIYELSVLMKKSQPYLQKEILFLESKGLLSLEKAKSNGRTRLKPQFNYRVLTFELDFLLAEPRG